MTVKLNATDKIRFPTMEVWARFFKDWSESLIEGLGNQHDLMDRQDAVSNAFVKLMFKKGIEDYGHIPETESDWYGCIKWQAKSFLKRGYDSKATWEKYHKAATFERLINAPAVSYCNIDREVRDAALHQTLREVCKEAKMKDVNVEAYVRWYLNGEDSAEVAEELGTNPNNLHAIRFRVEKLLKEKGKTKYASVRTRLFLEAA